MPVAGDKVNWSDITSLYTQLNAARTKFGFAAITPTSRQGLITQVADITNINSFVSEMSSNGHLTNVAKPITAPTVGSLMKPSFLDTLSTTITNIQNTDNFSNSSFSDSSFSFGNTGFSFGHSSFSNSGWSFGDSSWGFGNSGWGNSGFSNSGFSFFGGGDGNHYGQAWG